MDARVNGAMNEIQTKTNITEQTDRVNKRELSKAVSMALRAGSAAVVLSMSSQALSQSGFASVVELSDLDGSGWWSGWRHKYELRDFLILVT